MQYDKVTAMERKRIVDRFLHYVQLDTQSDPESQTFPSTEGQWDLLRHLKEELEALGLREVVLDQHGYLKGTLPSNHPSQGVPILCFIAHVDTSYEVSGKGVKPQIITNYDGKDIHLPGDSDQVIKVEENPNLKKVIGHDLITSDGTTLLGADDKAGIAEIMTMLEYFVQHPEIPRGTIKVLFTPDEEIGKGTEHLDVASLGADYGYTVDGSTLGEIENETFTAAGGKIIVKGYNVHPGYAKDKLVNAARILGELMVGFPFDEAPETTEEREGYYHPLSLKGDVSQGELQFILRDFEVEGMEKKKNYLRDLVEKIKKKYPKASIELEINDQYKNMRYILEKHPKVVNYALEAVRRAGVEPKLQFIRGGTDGAQLCYKNLPTPNIFAGGQNFHSKQEWISIQWMEKAVATLIELVKIWYEKEAK